MRAKLVDAHVHLTDDEFSGLSSQITSMLRSLAIKALSVSMDIRTARKNLELANSCGDVVLPFIGMHPWAAGENLAEFLAFVEDNANRITGIGEIGLDKKYVAGDEEGYRRQKKVFEAMLSLAEKLAKPVSIHSRGSVDDVLTTLKSYNMRGVLLHWFTGSKKQLAQAAEMGCYVSYGPVLVYSQDKQSLLRDTPRELILLETDGPVRYAGCFENRTALPSFLPSVALAASRTLHTTYEDACNMMVTNSARYLGSETL